MQRTTIVIPVYKDWQTLKICIESLKKHIASEHTVILVNDRGPEWQDLERRILAATEGWSNFLYFCNDENIGFVKTCNRAVMEFDHTDNDILLLNSDTKVTEGFLEEMQEVMHLSGKHGAVCPRSNSATFLSVPPNGKWCGRVDPEQSYRLFRQVKDYLPRYDILPTGVGFAILIRRKLIQRYGLFEEIYSPGYCEENDFCMRINRYGFNTVVANRAFVFHYESKSFEDRKIQLDPAHHRMLARKYPYFDRMAYHYRNHSINPVNHFMDLMANELYCKKRLLFSLYEIPVRYNQGVRYALEILDCFYRKFKNKYEISVLISHKADRVYKISKKYDRVYYPENLVQIYHLAFSLTQILETGHLILLNRTSLKYVFAMGNMKSIRCAHLLARNESREDVFRKTIQYCDGVISAKKVFLKDLQGYYKNEFLGEKIPAEVIQYGTGEKSVYSVAKEINWFLCKVIDKPVDEKKLQNRWRDLKYIETIYQPYVPTKLKQAVIIKIKQVIHNDFPSLYLFLKHFKKVLIH